MASGQNPRVAVLTAELSDAYQAAVWEGIAAEAEKRDISLVSFLGSRIDSPILQEAAANTIYELANGDNFAGLIVVSSAISTYLEQSRVQQLFDAHRSLPKVSIGVPVHGATSVTVDSRAAVLEITEHLIGRHDRRRLAIIAGPRWHVESQQRVQAILDCLAANDVGWDQRLLVFGTFEQDSGAAAMRSLLESDESIDAVLCLNDRMALGALEELHRMGVDVPGQLSIVGFDGIEETVYCTPPLSTVIQPLHDLGVSAVREVSRLMDGAAPRHVELYCKPLFRESCGCPIQTPWAHYPDLSSPEDLPEVQAAAADALIESARAGDVEGFLQRLNRELSRSLLNHEPLEPWMGLLKVVQAEIVDQAGRDSPETLRSVYHMLDSAREMFGEMKCRVQAGRRLSESNHTKMLRAVGLSLTEAFETPVLVERLREGLKRIGFLEAFLVLYDSGPSYRGASRLLMAIGDDRTIPPNQRELRFSRALLVPPETQGFGSTRNWIVAPLVFQSDAMGYLLLPGTFPDHGVYETLSKQLASSMKGALLMEQVRGHEQSLEREVARRTKELTVANRTLRSEVNTRIRLEKEVVEISKRTMERIGQDLHDDLCQHLAGIAMHVSAMENALCEEGSPVSEMAGRVYGLLNDSIERAKAIVRGLLPVGLREEGLLVAMNALADAATRSSGVPVSFEGSREFLALDRERTLELYRILQEALNNSIKHSGCSRVDIRLYPEPVRGALADGRLVAEVRDDGAGIRGAHDGDGMGMKIMKYRAEKANAELTIRRGNPGTIVRCILEPDGAAPA